MIGWEWRAVRSGDPAVALDEMKGIVVGNDGGMTLSSSTHSRGLSALDPVAYEDADDKGGKRQQPQIPTCPERGVVHDYPSNVSDTT